MSEAENPYTPPRATLNAVPGNLEKAAVPYRIVFVGLVIRIVFRFFGALIATFLALIEMKGLGVNWTNAGPLLAVFCVGAIASHFIINLRATSVRLNAVTGWPLYLAGMILAAIIVAAEMYPEGF